TGADIMNRQILLLVGLITILGCNRRQPGPANPEPPPATNLQVVAPKRLALPRPIEQPGSVIADEESPQYARLPGDIRQVGAEHGERVEGPSCEFCPLRVRGGTILAELAVPELQDVARQKRALLERAGAEVEQALRQQDVAQANIDAAEAQVKAARAGERGTL